MGHSEDEDAKTGGVEPMGSAVVVPMSRKARDMGHRRLDGAIGKTTREWETWATRQTAPRGLKPKSKQTTYRSGEPLRHPKSPGYAAGLLPTPSLSFARCSGFAMASAFSYAPLGLNRF